MKQITFGLRSSVLVLLVFLLSESHVQCAKQDKPVGKPTTEKQVTRNGRSWLKYLCAAGAGAIIPTLLCIFLFWQNKLHRRIMGYNLSVHPLNDGEPRFPVFKKGDLKKVYGKKEEGQLDKGEHILCEYPYQVNEEPIYIKPIYSGSFCLGFKQIPEPKEE